MDLPTDSFTLRINRIIWETGDAKSFVLERTDGQPLTYQAGQFLTLLFTNRHGKQERRNYSLSSIPGEAPMITVKRIPNGAYSRYLTDQVEEGQSLTTIGASGFFTLPAEVGQYKQYVFFAAGSGITPVFALIKVLLRNAAACRILLVYSNRSMGDAIFYDVLASWQAQYPDRFHIEFLFSDSTHIEKKRLGIYVLEKILERYAEMPRDRQLFYLCGPFEYMRMITIVLRNNGVPAEHIRKEIFAIESPTRKPAPPDTDAHRVMIELGSRSHELLVQYPQTILQAAKAAGIPLPYSCEAGQCGTCAVTCVAGKVWMWHNDVLMDQEVAEGRVLTCTGYPVQGDVSIRL